MGIEKPSEGLSGHGSSSGRRAKPEAELSFSKPGKRLRVFKIPILAFKIFFYCCHEILDASYIRFILIIFLKIKI